MKKILAIITLVLITQNAHAFFFFIPIPNLAKPTALQSLIDAYEKSSETKAVAFVSEDKTFGGKYWVWGHKSGAMTQNDANTAAMQMCEASLLSAKRQLAGGQPIYDFGQKRCEFHKFTNETLMLPPVAPVIIAPLPPPVIATPVEIPKVEESATAKKLRELDGLLNLKLITQEEYEKKRKEILSNL
jgi:hypothetical protein